MQAEHLILETDDQGRLVGVPELPPHSRIEAIFLLLPEPADPGARRIPPGELAGKAKIRDNIIAPVIPESDWNALA